MIAMCAIMLYRRGDYQTRDDAYTAATDLTMDEATRLVGDVRELLRAAADKVTENSTAIARPELLRELADVFGSQCIVLSVDAETSRKVSSSAPSSS